MPDMTTLEIKKNSAKNANDGYTKFKKAFTNATSSLKYRKRTDLSEAEIANYVTKMKKGR